GYLTAKLLRTKIKDIWLYIIVGGVWGIWHLPYYLFFLPHSAMHEILPVGRLLFAIISIVTMVCWSVMFIELYRLTKSIWPVVLLHVVEDSLINHLIIDGHTIIVSGREIFVSPVIGIMASVLYICVGVILRRNRIIKEHKSGQTGT
ncbi:MAG: CPBP family intramembrane metalloprotease, partial [Bacteroidales bacterium]|nr:CPBP family intramembrane metalloprotease [Bacteroidales bacterium]